MHTLALIAGLTCLFAVILDAFQTIILPRRPTGTLRITRFFFILTWSPWAALARHTRDKKVREQIYSVFGPLSLLLLLVVWALLLVTGFALVYLAIGSPFLDPMTGAANSGWLASFRTDLYVSGTTLFTLGLGDVLPHDLTARAVVILEAGIGLGFVALVIGYVPVLYGAFSRREVSIALLDARAGSPPTAGELLSRHAFPGGQEALIKLLEEWERWAAEILESHISYPILCYYRSQHDNQSWLSAMTAILDTCALLITIVKGPAARQAQLTFAISRHALIDLGHVFHLEQAARDLAGNRAADRLSPQEFAHLCAHLGESDINLCGDPSSFARLQTIRGLYEFHAGALADYLGMSLQGWLAGPLAKDQWKTITQLRAQAEAAPTASLQAGRRAVAASLTEADQEHDH